MSSRKRTLEVEFLADIRDMKHKLDQMDTRTQTTQQRFKSAGTAIKTGFAAVAGAAVLDVVNRMDQMATQAEATERRLSTVFGDMTAEMRTWVDEQNEAFGLSEVGLQDLASNIGDLLVPMGFARDDASDLTKEALLLANALDDWKGGTLGVEAATDRIIKGMLGEREGLKELNIAISEAAVTSRLAANGQDELTGAALDQAKAQATLELITEKSADALSAYTDRAGTAVAANKDMAASAANAQQSLAETLKPLIDLAKTEAGDLVSNLAFILTKLEGVSAGADGAADSTQGFIDKTMHMNPTTLGFATLQDLIDMWQENDEAQRANATSAEEIHDSWENIPFDIHAASIEEVTAATEASQKAIEESLKTLETARSQALKMRAANQQLADSYRDDLTDEITEFTTFFDAAVTEIDTSLDTLEKQFEERLGQQTRFWSNLAILANAGLDDLVEELREQGPTAAGVVEDLVADMDRAFDWEARIEENERQGEIWALAIQNGVDNVKDTILNRFRELGVDLGRAAAVGFDEGLGNLTFDQALGVAGERLRSQRIDEDMRNLQRETAR
jgi:hypothetical protein